MADVIVSVLVSDLSVRLASAAIQELALLYGFREDISSLTDDFTRIKAILNDAEQIQSNQQAEELWLKKLRSAALKIEDLLDDVSAEDMLRKLHKELKRNRVSALLFSFNPVKHVKMAHKVTELKNQFNEITAQISHLNSVYSVINDGDVGVGCEMPNRETSSSIPSSTVCGRNEVIKMVTDKICSPDIGKNDCNYIRVYTISGMAGLGKTTLAQSVYNHEQVKQHFQLRHWIYASENFQVKEIIKGIIGSIDKTKCQLSHLEELQNSVQEKLRGKRFLFVLDDVWIEESEIEKWEQLSKTLNCGAEGSVVVMTTRSNSTSRMMSKVPELQHELGRLSDQDSWSLFSTLAFGEGRAAEEIKKLESIGKVIVSKCEGLPLAVKSLGESMRTKSSIRDWQHVMDTGILVFEQNNILPSLKLSYDNLVPYIKRCFAYCCLLPKGHEMGKDLLILLWKANRLIPSIANVDWYVAGENIFNCLVSRSFFQVVDDKYKMLDLMHDLASYVMKDDCLIIEPAKDWKVPDEVLHLSSFSQEFPTSEHDLEKLKSLRSVFIFAGNYDGSVSHILEHVYLRVLYLAKIRLTTLPESICKIKLLKYLNLSGSWIKVLPEKIIYLQNLEVLLLNRCRNLNKLPDGMRYMRNLQYLGVDGCDKLKYLPIGIGKLTSLRRLQYFPVGKNEGAQIGELGDLNLIGPDLLLKGLYNVKDEREAKSANLKSKTHLLVLSLSFKDWLGEDNEEAWAHDEEVLEGLEPNPSLGELRISEYMGKNISPGWMVNLRNLVKIQFSECRKCQHIPPLGKLPNLKVIRLSSMHSLKCFHDYDTTVSGNNILFPRLEELIIDKGPQLINLPDTFPELKLLFLWGCNELRFLPANLPKLEVLELNHCVGLIPLPDSVQSFKNLNTFRIKGCENFSRAYAKDIGRDWHKISHIPQVDIDAPSSI